MTVYCSSYLRPLPVTAGHVDGGDLLEELLGGDEVGQSGEELGHVDEVHAGEDVLVEAQQAQRRAEQELLTVPAEDVPHPARQVQREGLTIQSEDPAGEREDAEVGILTKKETASAFLLKTRGNLL